MSWTNINEYNHKIWLEKQLFGRELSLILNIIVHLLISIVE
jgi:hypothetical protein